MLFRSGACSSDVGACSSDVGACSSDVGACSSDVGACRTDVGACRSYVGASGSRIAPCSAEEVGGTVSIAPTTSSLVACISNRLFRRLASLGEGAKGDLVTDVFPRYGKSQFRQYPKYFAAVVGNSLVHVFCRAVATSLGWTRPHVTKWGNNSRGESRSPISYSVLDNELRNPPRSIRAHPRRS